MRATESPFAPNAWAIARPTPALAPVTTTTRPRLGRPFSAASPTRRLAAPSPPGWSRSTSPRRIRRRRLAGWSSAARTSTPRGVRDSLSVMAVPPVGSGRCVGRRRDASISAVQPPPKRAAVETGTRERAAVATPAAIDTASAASGWPRTSGTTATSSPNGNIARRTGRTASAADTAPKVAMIGPATWWTVAAGLS
jgi:hypothetical protein